MARTQVDVINAALARVGANKITSITDGSDEASVASDLWDNIIQGEFGAGRWNFAKKQFALTQDAAVPLEGWDYAYVVPVDLLALHRVTFADFDIDFERIGDRIYTNTDNTSDDVVAHYTRELDPGEWPADFALAISTLLASEFAISLREDNDLADLLERRAARRMARARTMDQQGTMTKRLTRGRLLTRRLG